jgi:DNA-binding NarL/FixJ family response regulator
MFRSEVRPAPDPAPLRVMLADDHPVVLAGVKALVAAHEGLLVVGEAVDGLSALRLAAELVPDILVLDISMPGLNGVKVADALRTTCPSCRILALSVHEDRGYLRQLLDLGVAGYMLKRSAAEDLVRAILAIAAGGLYLDPAVAEKAVGQPPPQASGASDDAGADLSDREIEVLRLTASGHSNKSTAQALGIGVKTVETYKARGMEKLGFRTRVELMRYAVQRDWLSEV